MYSFDKFIMETTRCVFGERSEPILSPICPCAKLRITYNITVCTHGRLGPLANTSYYCATNGTHRDVTVHAELVIHRVTCYIYIAAKTRAVARCCPFN